MDPISRGTRTLAIRILACLAGVLLAACAPPRPFPLSGTDRTLTPELAASNFAMARGRRVVWGGVIAAATNLPDRTELEVLSYPLDSSAQPDTGKKSAGRFILQHPGYLETLDYAPGRLVTATGTVTALRNGLVGKTPYRFPVLSATGLHLWPLPARASSSPAVQFGIGIGYFR